MGQLTDDNGPAVGLRWNLSDPGMDLLERAGLAALYMALRAAEEQPEDPKAQAVREAMSWELTPTSVEVRWGEATNAKAALTALFEFAWQTDKHGVLYLPAVHRDPRQRDSYFLRLSEHNGILRTSLQGKSQAKEELRSRMEIIDEDRELSFRFRPLKGKPAPHAASAKLIPTGNFADGETEMTAWVKPGIEPRFANVERAWQGPPDFAMLLMMAPAACLYQQVQGEGSSELQVIPDVRDLEAFDLIRPNVSLHTGSAVGPSDAAARFLAEWSTRPMLAQSNLGCRVVQIGIGGYYHKSNKTRISVLDVRLGPHSIALRRVRVLHRVMGSRFINQKPSAVGVGEGARLAGWFRTDSARGRISDNLIHARPWYSDLLVPPRWELKSLKADCEKYKEQHGHSISIPQMWFLNLRDQGRQLMELMNDTKFWDDPQERLFHESFRKVLWRLIEREKLAAGRGSRSFKDRRKDLYDKLYRRLMRAKTHRLLRKELIEILAEPPGRFSRVKPLRENPGAIWALVDHPRDWQKARDLALLTLTSYGGFAGTRDEGESVPAPPEAPVTNKD